MVFVNSALKIQCHVVKNNTPTDWAILPTGKGFNSIYGHGARGQENSIIQW